MSFLPVKEVNKKLEQDYKDDIFSDYPDVVFTPDPKGYKFKLPGDPITTQPPNSSIGCQDRTRHSARISA